MSMKIKKATNQVEGGKEVNEAATIMVAASGPLITTVNDLVAVITYYGLFL